MCRIPRFVHVSALGAAPGSTGGYFGPKGRAEEIVRQAGPDWTRLRPGRGVRRCAGPEGARPHPPDASRCAVFLPVREIPPPRRDARCASRGAHLRWRAVLLRVRPDSVPPVRVPGPLEGDRQRERGRLFYRGCRHVPRDGREGFPILRGSLTLVHRLANILAFERRCGGTVPGRGWWREK